MLGAFFIAKGLIISKDQAIKFGISYMCVNSMLPFAHDRLM